MTTSTMRFMAVVVGALVGGLLLAAGVSAAMRTNFTPSTILAHQSTVRSTGGIPPTPATDAPQPVVDVEQDEPEHGDGRHHDHGDGRGHDGGRNEGRR